MDKNIKLSFVREAVDQLLQQLEEIDTEETADFLADLRIRLRSLAPVLSGRLPTSTVIDGLSELGLKNHILGQDLLRFLDSEKAVHEKRSSFHIV